MGFRPVAFAPTSILHETARQVRSNLTPREQSIVQLIAEGHTNRSISEVLNLSVKTVETHRASAMRKLGMSSTAELVRYAIRKKLVAP